MSSGEPGYTRWQPSEYLKVAVCALPLIDKGKTVAEAYYAAQRQALPRERRRELPDIRKLTYNGSPQKYIDLARKLPEAERLALTPPPPEPRKKPLVKLKPAPRVKLDDGRDYGKDDGGAKRWITREKALLARRILYWQEKGDTRALSRLFIEAQEIELERDRRRPIASIQAGVTGGKLQATLDEGKQAIWQVQSIPFKPDDEPTSSSPAAGDEADRIGAMELHDPAQAEQAAKTAVEAPNDPQATTLAPTGERALSDAAKAFGDTVMQALDKLLHTHTEIILGNVYAKLSDHAASTAANIGAMIERGLRETVHKIVEAELGGPVAAPSTPAAPALHARQLKVDVFTFPDGVLQDKVQREVRATFNGSTDLRFVNPDARNYTPDPERHCIMLTQRIPRALSNSITAIGIEPIYIKATPAHVVHAIEELHRSAGTSH